VSGPTSLVDGNGAGNCHSDLASCRPSLISSDVEPHKLFSLTFSLFLMIATFSRVGGSRALPTHSSGQVPAVPSSRAHTALYTWARPHLTPSDSHSSHCRFSLGTVVQVSQAFRVGPLPDRPRASGRGNPFGVDHPTLSLRRNVHTSPILRTVNPLPCQAAKRSSEIWNGAASASSLTRKKCDVVP
jgi:hypothetical protein